MAYKVPNPPDSSMHLCHLPSVLIALKFPHAVVFVHSRSAGSVVTLSRGSIDPLITPKTSSLTKKS